MKRAFTLIFCFTTLFFLTSCGGDTKDNMAYYSVYNTDLGIAISLGMEKEKVDELLGESTKNYYYDYSDGLSIEYTDGLASYITISGVLCPWIAKHEIGPGSETVDVQTAYGEQEIFDVSKYSGNTVGITGLSLTYYLDKSGKESNALDNFVAISFHLNEDATRVTSISVSK